MTKKKKKKVDVELTDEELDGVAGGAGGVTAQPSAATTVQVINVDPKAVPVPAVIDVGKAKYPVKWE